VAEAAAVEVGAEEAAAAEAAVVEIRIYRPAWPFLPAS
jgi:hypothetical protein